MLARPVPGAGGVFAGPLSSKLEDDPPKTPLHLLRKWPALADQSHSLVWREALSRAARAASKWWVFRIPCKLACEGVGKTHRQLGLSKREPAEYLTRSLPLISPFGLPTAVYRSAALPFGCAYPWHPWWKNQSDLKWLKKSGIHLRSQWTGRRSMYNLLLIYFIL